MLEGILLKVAISAGGAAGTWLIAQLGNFLGKLANRYSQSTKLRFIDQVDDIIMAFVVELAETAVKEAKNAAGDGKLSKEEAEKFKKLVVEQVKKHFGIKTLHKLFGNSDLDLLLKAKVEKAVQLNKESQAYFSKK